MKYFGGIEGNSKKSHLLICDKDGRMVAETFGLGVDYRVLGITEAAKNVADLVDRAKEEAGIEQCTKLYTLGICLSRIDRSRLWEVRDVSIPEKVARCKRMEALGLHFDSCKYYKEPDDKASNDELIEELESWFYDVADHYIISRDLNGGIASISDNGGMALKVGIGSTSFLLNPDGTCFSCGGWGSFLGEEGSALHISYRAVKICLDSMEGFNLGKYSTDLVWKIIQDHFQIEEKIDLLQHFYKNFDREFFAGLCPKLALAAQKGDKLCEFLFSEAGSNIAKHVLALLPNVHRELISNQSLNIVCMGSVWQSWDLFKYSFENELSSKEIRYDLKFFQLLNGYAIGALYLGVNSVGIFKHRHFKANAHEFFRHFKDRGESFGVVEHNAAFLPIDLKSQSRINVFSASDSKLDDTASEDRSEIIL